MEFYKKPGSFTPSLQWKSTSPYYRKARITLIFGIVK